MENTHEYCLIRDGIVKNVIYADEAFATQYATRTGYTCVRRPVESVGVGHLYHDGKFWRIANDLVRCEGGMTHDGATEPCAGGEVTEVLETTHEEEIV